MSEEVKRKHRRSSTCWSCLQFFCPPCPSKMTDKVVFNPPFPPHYKLDLIDPQVLDYSFLPCEEVDTEGFRYILKMNFRFMKSSLGNDIAVLYIKCSPEKKYTILYSHGNAIDLGHAHRICVSLSVALKCDVVSYDYSGYGHSGGKPSEKNIYEDIKAAWEYTLSMHEPRPERIILYGQSLGTSPTIDLATKVTCAGVILQSAFKSSLSVVCSNPRKVWSCMDRFKK